MKEMLCMVKWFQGNSSRKGEHARCQHSPAVRTGWTVHPWALEPSLTLTIVWAHLSVSWWLPKLGGWWEPRKTVWLIPAFLVPGTEQGFNTCSMNEWIYNFLKRPIWLWIDNIWQKWIRVTCLYLGRCEKALSLLPQSEQRKVRS